MMLLMEVDEALTRLGSYSKWHLISFCLISTFSYVPGCWQMLSFVFIGGMPDYTCNVTEGTPLPMKLNLDNELVIDRCHEYVDFSVNNETKKCTNGFSFTGDFDLTVVNDFMLVCEREYLVELAQTIFFVAVMTGALVCTILADKFGRKWVNLACQWLMVVVGTITAFATTYEFFVVLRVFAGCLQQGILLSAFVQSCELFPAEQRTFGGLAVNICWALAMMALAGLGYCFRNWRNLQLVLSVPWIISIIGIWLFPESVPWLVANNKVDEAETIIKRAIKINGVEENFPNGIFKRDGEDIDMSKKQENREKNEKKRKTVREFCCGEKKEDGPKSENILTVFKHPKLRRYVLIMCSLWFVNSLVYYGLSMSTSSLAGDRYLNFFISGAVEFPAYIQCIFVLQRFGRRIPLCIYHFIAGIALIISVVIPKETGDGTSLTWLTITFTMIGKFGITGSFGTIFLYAGEIFPTNVRNTGIGICSVAAKIGGMLAPFSALLARQIFWLPGVIFGGLSIAVGLMTFALPETLGQPLPQSIDDTRTWNKERRRSSYMIPLEIKKEEARRRSSCKVPATIKEEMERLKDEPDSDSVA